VTLREDVLARVLTQLAVDKAKPGASRRELPDGPGGVPGFALRIGETGVKSYVLRYRVGGRQNRVTIGSAAVLSLAEARQRARKLVDQAKAGIDPAAAKAERRAQQQNTVRAVAQEYLDRHVKRNLKSAASAERRLQRDVIAAWGERPIQNITKAHVVRLVDSIADRGAGVSANRTLQQVKAFLSWCVKRSILEVNVAVGVDLPHKERSRERTLTGAEIKGAWEAFMTMGWPYGDVGRLLLLLAQRAGETSAMRWGQLDLENATWGIPPEVAKTGAEHVVPLPPAALEILDAIPRIGASPLVFPGRGDRPVTSFGRALQRVHELSGTAGWTWHDLRRTARSGMARLGVQPHIAERALNHAVGSKIARTYDLHRYLPEVRQALLLWSAEVDRIVSGEPGKIVTLRPAVG
jgi:integrase